MTVADTIPKEGIVPEVARLIDCGSNLVTRSADSLVRPRLIEQVRNEAGDLRGQRAARRTELRRFQFSGDVLIRGALAYRIETALNQLLCAPGCAIDDLVALEIEAKAHPLAPARRLCNLAPHDLIMDQRRVEDGRHRLPLQRHQRAISRRGSLSNFAVARR